MPESARRPEEEENKAQNGKEHQVKHEQAAARQPATETKEDCGNDEIADKFIELRRMAADAVNRCIAFYIRVYDTHGTAVGVP